MHKNSVSPRIGILGASTYPSEAEFGDGGMQHASGQSLSGQRIDDVSASVNAQIKSLEDQLVKGYDLLQVFKEEADDIRKQVDVMMNVLVEKAEVIQDEMHDESRKDYKQLRADMKAQRDENELLYKEMKKLLKETESQR